MSDSINVEDLIDNRRLGWFGVRVLALAVIALVADGYDVQVMAYAAPSLVKAWHVPRSALGPIFSASLFGILFGAPLFGWIGDRVGRKSCIIIASLLYGGFCLACLGAHDLRTLELLRFLTGVGLGGVMPNAVAIAAELAPRRFRAMMASFTAVGITLGGVIPGLLVASIPPGETWRTLFLVGGLTPLVIAALTALGLPESVAFLVQRGGARSRIVRQVRALDRNAVITDQTTFAVRPTERSAASFGELFRGDLAWITPLLWVMFASTLLSIYLLSSWLPTLLESSGFTPAGAAGVNSLFQAGGAMGCIIVSLLLGRIGAPLVAALFGLTLVAVAVVARASLGETGLAAAVTVCGVCLIGAQAALNGTAGLIYPTAVRGRGVGMALGVGRIGSVVGPLLGGAMVTAGVSSARDLFLIPLIPLALGGLAALAVMRRLNLGAGDQGR